MWTQIVGKVALALAPPVNHGWAITFHLTSRGLTTQPLPHGLRTFTIEFDFVEHQLIIEASDGARRTLKLEPRSVADFHRDVMTALNEMALPVKIWPVPVEIPDPIPFERDSVHRSYDPDAATRFWRVLVKSCQVFSEFRSNFLGKVSPVHFFWGAFDLAVARFSGRPAPQHPGAPYVAKFVAREAYSHEVSSCGFWPGGGPVDRPVFYAYAYPEPEGFSSYPVQPREAFYSKEMKEFLLPYDVLRTAESPDHVLLSFLQSTYEAAANLGRWDRTALEHTQRQGTKGGIWRTNR
jgi:hypothetical protein